MVISGFLFGAFGLAALCGGWLIVQVAAANRSLESQAEANRQAADLLERIAVALETLSHARPGTSPGDAAETRGQALAAIRGAIKAAEWDLAEERVRRFAEDHPEDPEGSRLADELATARQIAAQDLRVKIDAARAAHDAARVLDLHTALRPLIAGESLRAIDHDLVSWFMSVIQKRLRIIPIQADVVVLAGRVAEHFDDTREGASLRASLPTLRRSVGLCPRCGAPYSGLADACPRCLGTAVSPAHEPNPDEPGTIAVAEHTPDTTPTLAFSATIPLSPGDEGALSLQPSEELEDFRRFLDPPA